MYTHTTLQLAIIAGRRRRPAPLGGRSSLPGIAARSEMPMSELSACWCLALLTANRSSLGIGVVRRPREKMLKSIKATVTTRRSVSTPSMASIPNDAHIIVVHSKQVAERLDAVQSIWF